MVGVLTGILDLSFYPKTVCLVGFFVGFLEDVLIMGHVSDSRMSLHGFDSPGASVKETPSFPHFFKPKSVPSARLCS